MVPFDLDGLLPELMTDYEIGLLNSYHAMVFEKISPYLEGDELEWLKHATRAI
jgi:Xaa-Pro aminopeptidase